MSYGRHPSQELVSVLHASVEVSPSLDVFVLVDPQLYATGITSTCDSDVGYYGL